MQQHHSDSNLFALLDQCRRELGKYLDALGVGPVETPSRAVVSKPGITLKSYEPAATTHGVAVLLVPAPIKRAYLWDLAPWASVVRHCLDRGLCVYLVQWEQPGEGERNFGLAEYADRLILECVNAIQAETGQPALFLAGHSLGGTLAALFSALHPERVRGLILLGAPLHFGPTIGLFGPLVAAAPPAHMLTAAMENVPGSVLNEISLLASLATFGWSRWLDLLNSLTDLQDLRTHGLVERWTLDELALPQRFFEEVVEKLYREDQFIRGTLMIGEQRAAARQVTAPLLSVVDKRCTLTPPEAVLPFHQTVQSGDTQILWYEGDVGVSLQHVGMLVGKHAHQHVWPEIIHWIQAHAR
jgi:polyhydroxyalkanoate synthase